MASQPQTMATTMAEKSEKKGSLLDRVIALYTEKDKAGELEMLTPEETRASTERHLAATRELIALAKSKLRRPSP